MYKAKYYSDWSPWEPTKFWIDIDIQVPRSNSVTEDITPEQRDIICTKLSLSDVQKLVREKIQKLL